MSGLKRMAAKVAAILETIIKATKAFFEIGDGDNIVSKSKKVGVVVAKRTAYVAIDYWTAFLCAGLVSILKFWEYGFVQIFFVTWAYDFTIAIIMLIISIKSGHDITLGEAFRRAADVIHSSHKIAGRATFGSLTLKATIWDGPEQIAIFFKKELATIPRMIGLIFFLTIIQGAFWSWVYSLGYDSVYELLKNMF